MRNNDLFRQLNELDKYTKPAFGLALLAAFPLFLVKYALSNTMTGHCSTSFTICPCVSFDKSQKVLRSPRFIL